MGIRCKQGNEGPVLEISLITTSLKVQLLYFGWHTHIMHVMDEQNAGMMPVLPLGAPCVPLTHPHSTAKPRQAVS